MDGNGTAVASYSYDPWGKLLSKSENSTVVGQPIRYASYVYDSETSLYYLQARYYDPETARFVSRDPELGTLDNPLSQNAYAYTNDDPVNNVDPTGNFPSWHTDYSLDLKKYLHWIDGKFNLRFNSAGKLVEHSGKVIGEPKGRELKILEKLKKANPGFFSPKTFIPMFYIPIKWNNLRLPIT